MENGINSSVDYILKHFYYVVNFMEISFIFSIISALMFYLNMNQIGYSKYIRIVTSIIVFFSIIITVTVTMMENILLSALAIYRFSLYFFPNIRNFLSNGFKVLPKIVTSLYIILFLNTAIQRIIRIVMIAENYRQNKTLQYIGTPKMDFGIEEARDQKLRIMEDRYWCEGKSCMLLMAVMLFVPLIFIFSIFVLYPFYVLSFRSNRERDDEVSNTSVFYILRHFYHVVQFMEICYLVNIVSIVTMYFIYGSVFFTLQAIFGIIVFISLNITVTVTTMENIMLSVLAVYRFTLYFLPDSESFLTASLNFFRKTIKVLYVLVFFVNFLQRLAKCFLVYENLLNTGNIDFNARTPDLKLFDNINERTYIGLTAFQLFSACLYFPIVCSVRKMGRLQSAKASQPEKYILYQTFFLVVFRIFYIPMIIFLFLSRSESKQTLLWYGMTMINMCITHFIIQASYLSCNKKHMESLLNICRKQNTVAPTVYTKHVESSTIATD
uniref:G_PROTEIN_RECEP_F1_2 domain-containing protein n=1 Tax=Caenorhabditis tropicalis TaxID=1561998 RepID=A0A1I7T6N1_9PELO